jgi:hypothetical protein
MDAKRTGESFEHLTEEQIGLAADRLEPLDGDAAGHLERCAVCRSQVEAQRSVSAFVADLGAAYREEAPPGWPAYSAIEARLREAEADGFWARLRERLGASWRPALGAAGVGLVLLLVAAAVLVVLDDGPRPVPPGRVGPDPVAVAPPALPGVGPGPVVPPALPPVHPVEIAPPPREPSVSSVVAMVAARDVQYVMMDVPFEGGSTAVIWLSELPPLEAGADEVPM